MDFHLISSEVCSVVCSHERAVPKGFVHLPQTTKPNNPSSTLREVYGSVKTQDDKTVQTTTSRKGQTLVSRDQAPCRSCNYLSWQEGPWIYSAQ